MGTRGRPSQADEELAAVIGVVPSQIRDWRDDGLLPGPKLVRIPGQRRRGGTYRYDDAASRQAVELSRLMRHRRKPATTLMLFGAGYEIRERTLRRAFRDYLDKAEYWIRRAAPGAKSTQEVADQAASKILRSRRSGIPQLWKTRAREHVSRGGSDGPGNDAFGSLHRGLATAIRVVLGDTVSEEDLGVAFEVAGLNAASRDRLSDGSVLAETVVSSTVMRLVGEFNFPALRRTIEEASLDDLRWAAQTFAALASMLSTTAQLFTATTGLRDAAGLVVMRDILADARWEPYDARLATGVYGPLVMLTLRRVINDIDVQVRPFVQMKPRVDAVSRLIASLPAEYQGPGGDRLFAELPPDRREELLAPWRRNHPEDAQALKEAEPPGS